MPAAAKSRLLIVDGHAFAYRAFHAISQLSSPDGIPTNAVYGFIKILARMQAQVAPSHWAVIWDGGLSAQRMAELPEYKANRPPMPAALERQIDGIQQYLDAARVASWVRAGVEADDWIAALARRAAGADFLVVIASSDKDFMQLVSPAIGLFNPNDPSGRIWTADEVVAKAGVRPEQIVDWLSLVGDSVDNIQGVPGVGAKTAASLLNQFGSVDELERRCSEVKSERTRASLQSGMAAVRRNQRLIRLDESIPCDLVWDDLAVQPADADRLRRLYAQWGFKTLSAQLDETVLKQGELL
jgi:DNA polymerase I